MKVEFWVIGKTSFSYLQKGIDDYKNRLNKMTNFKLSILPETKDNNEKSLMKKEAKVVLDKLQTHDFLVLLDERGKTYSSIEFAKQIEEWQMNSYKKLVFLIGGAYGFDQTLYDRANSKLSLSTMTFSHQIIRLIFMEQVYRAYSIIKGLPYHHG